MAKKKTRSIIVVGEPYVWSVTRIDENYVRLKVWCSHSKSTPWFQVRYRLDDPWLILPHMKSDDSEAASPLQLTPIRPKQVAAMINAVIANASAIDSRKRTLSYRCEADGTLIECADD